MNGQNVAAAKFDERVAGHFIDRQVRKGVKAGETVDVDQIVALDEIRDRIVPIGIHELENVGASSAGQRVRPFFGE